MDRNTSNQLPPPPPVYSEDAQSHHPNIESVSPDDQPLILIMPSEGKSTFQSGFLGAEGDISSLEGEVHIKSASMEKWNNVSIIYRSEEYVGLNKVELGFLKHILYSQQQAPSSSTSPDASTLPGVLPFSIPLTPDTPQCLHTSASAISHTLTVTLESSTLPSVSKSAEIHTRRYTTVTSPYLPVAPRRIILNAPTPTTVEIPRTIFRSGEPIPLYWEIPPPEHGALQRGVRLRNLRAELVRLIRVDNGDEDDDGESIVSEDETGWAPAEPDMGIVFSPTPTAGFEKGSSMQANQPGASSSIPSGGPIHPTIVTRSGVPARLHPTRSVRVRLVLHGLSHDPRADIQRQENTHEICASISQTTLMHDVSFHVIMRASFLVGGQEQTIKGRIPVTIIPRVVPQVEVPGELEEAYMKKHDKPPTKTVRMADADHGEGPSVGPPPAFDEGTITSALSGEPVAPPPFVDAPYAAPPLESSGSQPPTFNESESRVNDSDGRLPTFFESESAAVAASSSSISQPLPPAPSGTFGEWTQTCANSTMELRFPGEGSSYGFNPQDQFDGLTLGLRHNEQVLPNDPRLPHPHSNTMLSPDILADIHSDLPPPLTVGDPVSNLALRLQILVAASSDVNETAPPPPPALDDPADPPPSINDHFHHTAGGNVPLTETPRPVPTDGALPPYLNPGVTASAVAAGPPAYTDIPPREGR
ncbi:hypothetical protein CTheo_2898 [Ceratobasidium theobromae]|uniref:Uncharacterized protein n=1 Tax=Ceratobasidium theobromae TaxID=1582974 RepID=A0A5N5QPA1_9AGAM|nr:hypothetical protein CTheo_2898 [Ceratobasidium theobromae]